MLGQNYFVDFSIILTVDSQLKSILTELKGRIVIFPTRKELFNIRHDELLIIRCIKSRQIITKSLNNLLV